MKIVQGCRIKNGKFDLKQRNDFLSDISKLKDGDYILTIERQKKKRSLYQNSYYWGVIVPLVKSGLTEQGWRVTTTQVHEDLKKEFNLIEIVNEKNGEIKRVIGSSTEMSTSQMMDYFAKISQWAAEYLGINIPEPNEQLKIEL